MRRWLIIFLVGCAHRTPIDAVAETRGFYYADNEGLSVVTSGVHLEQPVGRDALLVGYLIDHVKIAPVDAVSRASAHVGDVPGIDKDRNEFTLGYSRDVSTARTPMHLIAQARLSVEPDYFSASGELRWSGELNRSNTFLSAAIGYGHDTISPESFHPDDAGRWPASHQRVTGTFSLRQLLSRRVDLSAGVGAGYQFGRLSSPYRRALVLEGLGVFASYHEEAERHPDERARFTGFLGIGGYLGRGAALHFRLGGYADSWSVMALAPEIAGVFELGARFLLSIDYRYYVQSSADFYQPKYAALASIRSGDRRLGSLDEHAPSVELRWTVLGERGRATSMQMMLSYELSVMRYWRIDTTVIAHLPSLGISFLY